MYIERVIIDGFKSYSTRTEVGLFDPQFTAITGLNGSGKSNILDSICFVLGISNLSLVRCSNLQELVYKQGQAGITKASVCIVFNNENPAQQPHGYDMKEITVTREIIIGGKNKYKINSHVVQKQAVDNLFHSVQLNVNNPHFLIMQGRITKVINMKPPEILGMIEEAAGTRMYETKKEASVKLMEKKQSKVEEITRILTEEITPTLEKLEQERANYLRWASQNNEVERLQRWVTAADYTALIDQVSSGVDELKGIQEQCEAFKQREAEATAKLDEMENRITELIRSGDDARSNTLKRLEERSSELGKDLVKLQSKWDNKKQTVEEAEASVKAAKDQVAGLEKDMKKKQDQHAKALKTAKEADGKLEACTTELERLEKSLAALNAGMDDGEGESSLQQQLMDAQTEQSQTDGEGKRVLIELQGARKQIGPLEKELNQMQKEGKDVKSTLDKKRAEVANAKKALDKLGFDPRKFGTVEVKHRQEKGRLEETQARVTDAESRLERLNFHYNKPGGFDGSRVKGVVAKLFEVKQQFRHYSTAVEVSAGGKLFMVVVDNEQTAKVLLGSQLKRRVTIIPLTKIAANTCSDAQVKMAKSLIPKNQGEVHFGLEVVGAPAELQAAMQFVFGNVMYCDSPETAKIVTFHPQVRVRTVTREGDVYDPAGTVEGGSAPRTGNILARLEELRQMHAELTTRKSSLDKVTVEWAQQCKLRDEADAKERDVALREHELKMAEDRADSTEHGAKLKQVEDLRKFIADGEATLNGMDDRKAAIKAKVAKLEKQVKDFAKDKAGKSTKIEKLIADQKKQSVAVEQAAKEAKEKMTTIDLEVEAGTKDMEAATAAVQAAEALKEKEIAEVAEVAKQVDAKNADVELNKEELTEVKKQVAQGDKELKSLQEEKKGLSEQKHNAEVQYKKLSHQLNTYKDEQDKAKADLERFEKESPWILQEKEFFGKPGTQYDFQAQEYTAVSQKLSEMKEEQKVLSQMVNKKVVGMYEKAEEEHKDLISKRDQIVKDKDKIEAVIQDLDQKKKDAIFKTHGKVSKDFGDIFATLLPNVRSKLEAPEGMTCNEGLEIKVAFNDVWKQSLQELSGGQKSLLALSLVLALLVFKPAPMYILDEIDAALDLSHTQNIGQMIKQYFPQSQFIVVSLKEGMFQNANVLFKTRFLDGCSHVDRLAVGDRPAAAKAPEAPAAIQDGEKGENEPANPRKRKKQAA